MRSYENVGRKKIFDNAEDMQIVIDAYFDDCVQRNRIPTIEMLAFNLGMSRMSLLNYQKEDEFFYTIKRAKELIQAYKVDALVNGDGNTTGLIFDLKNNSGYSDKTTMYTSDDPSDMQDISDEELLDVIEKAST